MAKRLFLLIIASIIGVAGHPLFLAASDSVDVTGLNNAGIVETVPLPEPKPEPAPTPVVVAKAPATGAAPVTPNYANSITITGRTLEIIDVAATAIDAGTHVNRYGKMLYGHNSAAVFGALSSLGVGSTFTVTSGGATTTYQVREVTTYQKIDDTTLGLDGQTYRMSIITRAKGKYDLSLMTCAGESYGNGDASHRLVIFASAI